MNFKQYRPETLEAIGGIRCGFSGRLAMALLWALGVTLVLTVPGLAAPPPPPLEPEAGGILGLPQQTDPELPARSHIYRFPPGLKSLWLEALEQSEVQLRREAIEAFAEAHEVGLEDLEDVPGRLVEVLDSDPSLLVRRTAAEALLRFDHSEAANALLEASEVVAAHDHEMVVIVDPVLARWGYEPAREVWRQRAEDSTALLAVRRSAVRSLGEIGAASDADLLTDLAASADNATSLRLEAAKVLGWTVDSGLVETAQALASDEALGRMLAASMLHSHAGDDAVELLVSLVRGDDVGVAAVALGGLINTTPQQVFEMRQELLEHREPNLRYGLADALEAIEQTESVRTLELLLDDPSRAVRWRARETLIILGEISDLHEAARSAIDRALVEAGPFGQEQAALAAGKLDYKEAAPVLAEMLGSETWRVRRAAANALHELAVEETLPAIHARLREMVQNVKDGEISVHSPDTEHEMTGLIMGLGVMGYVEANEILREYIPKGSPFSPKIRGQAIWALGHVYKDAANDGPVRALVGRLTDIEGENPESDIVRRYSAVALGLMGADEAVTSLEEMGGGGGGAFEVRVACMWALERITGESQPEVQQPQRRPQWFLEPLSD